MVGTDHRMKTKTNGVQLYIDDKMRSMNWLKKFNKKYVDTNPNYEYNESSGFDPRNLCIQDSIKDKKIKTAIRQDKKSFKDVDFGILNVKRFTFSNRK